MRCGVQCEGGEIKPQPDLDHRDTMNTGKAANARRNDMVG